MLKFSHLKNITALLFLILFCIDFFAFGYLPGATASGLSDITANHSIYNIPSERYRVKSVDYLLPRDIPIRDIENLFLIKSGQMFSMYRLEKTIKMLYSTNYFSNIMVFSKINRKQEYMHLKFIFVRRVYIKKVHVNGLKDTDVPDKYILKLIPLKDGGQFFKYYKKRSIGAIKKAMYRFGYPDANVNISSYILRKFKKYVININITPNDPVIISKVFVKYKVFYPKKKVLMFINSVTGKPLNKFLVKKLAKQIKAIYYDNGYLNAVIPAPEIKYLSRFKAVIIVKVHPGNKFIFHFKGISPLKPDFIKESVLNFNNVFIFNKGMFATFKTVLTNFYARKGYFYARIHLRVKKDINNRTISVYYVINKGYRVAIRNIIIKGSEPFGKSTILSLMKTRVTTIFDHEYFNKIRLADDMVNIENYYNNKGYVTAEVSDDSILSKDKKSVIVRVVIKKGIRTYVKNITITGLPPDSKTKDLIGYFNSMRNKPFYIIKAENGKNLLSTRLANSGYVFSKVRLRVKYGKTKNGRYVYLHYDIESGPLTRINHIIILGNTVTQTAYIKGFLLFKKGEIYNQKNIIETQNRLYRAGIFNYVSINIENPQNIEPYKNIIVKVKDAKSVFLNFGAGYGTYVRYRGFAQIEDSNLLGSGKSLSAIFSESSIYTNLLLDYYDPAIYNYRGLAFNVKGLDTDIITLNYRLHKEGGIFSLIRRFNANLKGLFSYEIFYNTLSGLNPGAQTNTRDIGFTKIDAISSSVIYNTKNNMLNPTSGILTTLKLTYSASLLGSQINFVKLFFHTEQFIPFIFHTMFLYSLRLGYIKPLSPTTRVPINERFFLGGRTTVRGFPQDSIGLIGLNSYHYPIGGDIMENYNLQLNIPVYGGFNFFIFQDGGNVFSNIRKLSLFALYKSVGAGIMYMSPIGPVSFSYGFILNRKPYWPSGGINFTIGTSF